MSIVFRFFNIRGIVHCIYRMRSVLAENGWILRTTSNSFWQKKTFQSCHIHSIAPLLPLWFTLVLQNEVTTYHGRVMEVKEVYCGDERVNFIQLPRLLWIVEITLESLCRHKGKLKLSIIKFCKKLGLLLFYWSIPRIELPLLV